MKRLLTAVIAVIVISLSSVAFAGTGWWWGSIGDGLWVRTNNQHDLSSNDGWIYKRYRSCHHYGGCCSCIWQYKKIVRYNSTYYGSGSSSGEYRGYGSSSTYNTIVNKLADMVTAREKANAQAQAQQLNHNQITELFDYFGLKGSLSGLGGYGQLSLSQGLGGYGAYGGYVANPYTPYAQQGNTVYTSTVSQTNYPLIDAMAGLNSIERMQAYAVKSGDAARSDYADLVAMQMSIEARKAEIAGQVAKIQQAAEVLRSSKDDRVIHTERTETIQNETSVEPSDAGGEVNTQAEPSPEDGAMRELQGHLDVFNNMIATKCANCHAGEGADGGFDLESFPMVGQAEQANMMAKIKARVNHPDPEKRMPKDADPVTLSELAATDAIAATHGK